MSKVKKLITISGIALVLSVAISFSFRTHTEVKVPSGFVFGPPVAQQEMRVAGIYRMTSYGFPATYHEVNSFSSTSGSYYETSYDSKPFKWLMIVVDVVFWMSLFTILWMPIALLDKSRGGTYFFTSSKKKADTTVVADDNTRD